MSEVERNTLILKLTSVQTVPKYKYGRAGADGYSKNAPSSPRCYYKEGKLIP